MTDRVGIDRLIRELHAARVRGDLAAMCRQFDPAVAARIVGSSNNTPIEIHAGNLAELRPWLNMLVRAFRVSEYELFSVAIDGSRATAHWRARIHSKITGAVTNTELVDLFVIRDGKVAEYIEIFVPV